MYEILFVRKSGAVDTVMVWSFKVTSDFNKEVMKMKAVMLCEILALTHSLSLSLWWGGSMAWYCGHLITSSAFCLDTKLHFILGLYITLPKEHKVCRIGSVSTVTGN